MTAFGRVAFAALTFTLCSLPAFAQEKVGNDIPDSFTPPKRIALPAPKPDFDYVKRVEMIPMRDGTKLYTVTQRIWSAPGTASFINLPGDSVAPGSQRETRSSTASFEPPLSHGRGGIL